MAPYHVICITKLKPESTHEHITYIGYYESRERPKVIVAIDEVIRRIEANKWEFYLSLHDSINYLEVYTRAGIKYIRTVPDTAQKDSLLSLLQC